MKENRLSYLITTFAVVLLGMLSRKISLIPLFVGDMLYAIMIYFGIRFLFISTNRIKSAVTALFFCYGIEALQLYNAEWTIAIRQTVFGRYVLGQGFLWSDILAYSLGIAIASNANNILFSRFQT